MYRLIAAEFRTVFTTWLLLWLFLMWMRLTALRHLLAINFASDPDNPSPRQPGPVG